MGPGFLLPPAGGARRLAAATSVNSLGNGVFATIGTLYFLRFAGLSVAQVGTGLAIAAGVAMVVGLPIGRLADRVGVRTVFLGLLLVSGGAVAAYVGVRGWAPFLVVAVVAVSAERSTAGIRNAFIAQVVDGGDRVRTRAYLRSVTNVGAAVGAGLGGIALTSSSRGCSAHCSSSTPRGALQVRVSASVDTPGSPARGARQAGVVLAAPCVVLGLSGSTSLPATISLLVLGGALRLAGELLQSASGWAMSFAAAPPELAASYQALYSTAFSGAAVLGPLVSTAIVLAYGWSGWADLAVAFLVAGAMASRAAPPQDAPAR